MKILEVGPYPPPYGGWSRRIKLLRQGLIERGHECMVLSHRWPQTGEYDGYRSRIEFLQKVSSYCHMGYALHVHINAKTIHMIGTACVCRLVSWSRARRMVLTIHGGPDQRMLNSTYAVVRSLVRVVLRAADRIVCDSDAVGESIVRAGAAPENVAAISPFTRQYLGEIRSPGGALGEFCRSRSPLLVCYAYVLNDDLPVRTVAMATAALRKKNPALGIVLLGPELVEAAWKRIEAGDYPRDCVRWEGNLPAPVFLGLLRDADVFIRSSPTDGEAACILEAMALGVPVVASRLAVRPAWIEQYDIGDSEMLVRKVEAVLSREQVRRRNCLQIEDTLAHELDLLEEVCLC